MPSLQKLINISSTNSLMYEVMVNDGGPDGGNNVTFMIFAESLGGFASEAVQTAAQALAESLGSVSEATLVSFTKVSVDATSL